MPASSSYVDGFSVGPPGSGVAPSDVNRSSMPLPATTATTPQAAVGSASRSVRCSTCSCMSATSSRETEPAPANSAVARSGLVGVDVHLERPLVADDEHGVADRLELSRPTLGASSSTPVTAKFVQ